MPKTKALGFTAAVAALALGLTACGGGGESGEGGEGGGDALQFGYIFPESGDLSFLGPPQITAAEYAIQEINDAGGVLGTQLPELVGGDEAGDAAQANEAANRLLDQGVDAILGAAASGMTMAIIDSVTGAEVVQCSGSNTSPALSTYEDGGYYFRTAPSDLMQGPVLAETILADGHQSVAIAYRADDYGEGLANSVAEALEASGAEITAKESYDPNATNFDAAVNAIADSKPDAVVLVSFEEGVQAISGLLEAGIKADQMYSADGMNSTTLNTSVDEGDPSVLDGFKGTAPGVNAPEFDQALAEFAPDLEDYQYAAQVYDCAITIALAAEAAGSTAPSDFVSEMIDVTRDGEKCTSFAECRDLLSEGADIDFDGVSGPLDFDENGDVTAASFMIYGFEDGEYTVFEYVQSGGEE
ncbi:ABC transporter substrate-binding protein [Thermobifida cellulosilytica]|uniref:Branched-chain amino acid ABC transporter substrate-binding protein n=1 Tax=Thermobifida cellulosilytica TB100 TaxID=665004 RepID=A0A147KMP9_THECS|nr:ABC transporter substrate-binding protein [Thermobifida cellulosilytica]KUP98543.1 branched-chain amino acid ABC transporter substrate-binding protein [Thermobifida cellulosilytica TB100]